MLLCLTLLTLLTLLTRPLRRSFLGLVEFAVLLSRARVWTKWLFHIYLGIFFRCFDVLVFVFVFVGGHRHQAKKEWSSLCYTREPRCLALPGAAWRCLALCALFVPPRRVAECLHSVHGSTSSTCMLSCCHVYHRVHHAVLLSCCTRYIILPVEYPGLQASSIFIYPDFGLLVEHSGIYWNMLIIYLRQCLDWILRKSQLLLRCIDYTAPVNIVNI